MNLKIKVYALLLAVLLPGQASAHGQITASLENKQPEARYHSFDESCNSTTAKSWKNVKLKTVFADITAENSGFYITSTKNEIWRLGQGSVYPMDFQTEEMRSLAKTAVLSGVGVNICGSEATSPATVWIIELVAW